MGGNFSIFFINYIVKRNYSVFHTEKKNNIPKKRYSDEYLKNRKRLRV